MDYRLEKNIAFDKSKYSENFGKPYLRTKAIAIKELNQSIYQEPSVLGTDNYDWNLRTSEYNKFIPKKSSGELLTLPKPFPEKSVVHLRSKVNEEGAYSLYEREVIPFENRTSALKSACRKLKHVNDYLAWQRRRFHSKGQSSLEEPNGSVDQYYSFEDDMLQDKNSSVFTSNMKQLEDDDYIDHEHVVNDQRNSEDNDCGANAAITEEEMKEDLPLYIDTYNEESVVALMKQIESLSNIDNEDGFVDLVDLELAHHTQKQRFQESQLKYKSKSGRKLVTVKETDENEETVPVDPRKRKQSWKHGYNPRFQKADPNEDITKLNAKTTFQLTDKITITMGHMDRALYKNSRKFGIKFDEKIQRKREILAKEKNTAERITASLEQNDEDYVPYFATQDYIIASMHATSQNKPFYASGKPLNSSSSSGAYKNQSNTVVSSVPQLPPLNSYQIAIATGVIPHAETTRADPVSKRVNQFYAETEEKLVFESPTPHAHATTTATTPVNDGQHSSETVASGKWEEDSVCLSRSVATTGQPTSVMLDLSRDGKLLGISLRSEVEVERPKSADALRKLVKEAGDEGTLNEKVNTTYKSMRGLLAERRRHLKKPKEKKNLTQIDYIPEEEAQFERQSLMYLYEQCNGKHWYNSTNWCTDAPVRSWYGVGLSVEGYVFELDLSDNNLSGEFPDSVSMFSRIESLNLSNNRLRGELPNHALCRMANLELLSVENNRLSGAVSFYMLSNLPKLSDLWLGRNRFSGSIGDDIGNMNSLVNLCMYGNRLTGCIPESICRLHKLEFLSLGNNQLTGEIPKLIINLRELRNLSLHNNQLTGEVPDYLQSIPYLEDIELFNNRFTGYVPSSMKELKAHKYT